ncbi:MAG: thioredoxin domain-containing protein, partial [Nitrososphaeraceae archaeon]
MSDDDDTANIRIKKSTFNKLIVIFVVTLMTSSFLAGGYIIGGLLEIRNSGQNSRTATLNEQQPISETKVPFESQEYAKISSVSIDDAPTKGKHDSSVIIIEFSDFQCQFCERFFSNTLPQIEEDYINTGKVKLVYKHFPIDELHSNTYE